MQHSGSQYLFYICWFTFYFKIPSKIKTFLDASINNIKNQIQDAEKLKDEAKNILVIMKKLVIQKD